MKKALFIVLALAVVAVALTGASKWPAIVRIYNGDGDSTAYFNFGGDEYPYVQFTVLPGETKTFSMARKVYDGELTYCGATKDFVLDARHNVWLNLPSCAKARQPWRNLFLGEPSIEKYNRYWETPLMWKFQY